LRTRHDGGFTEEYNIPENFELVDRYNGKDRLSGGYLSQSWTGWNGRIKLNATGRVDHDSLDGATVFSPQAGVTLGLSHALRLSLGFGDYAQFPDVSQLGSNLGGARLTPMRSRHSSVGLEYQVGSSTRLRVELYDRQDRNLLYQPYLDARLINGVLFMPSQNPLYENSLRGRARGVEIYVQKSLTRRLSGWVSYAYGHAQLTDAVTGDSFRSDWDQRQTVNAYVRYALRRTVDVSARWTYGSGFPVPGFLTLRNSDFYLTDQRNTLTLWSYGRLDFRVNKTWIHEKSKFSLFAEVLNATNKTNSRFGSLDGYEPNGYSFVSVDQMFPVLPSVGILWEK
jgi:outer membrane receptor for ferrienterochelin and colicin